MKNIKFILLITLFFAISSACLAQREVSGTVLDSLTRKPLPAANVTLLRGARAVSFVKTDSRGGFRLKADAGDRLSVTFMGYRKQITPVSSKNEYQILMSPAEFAINEVQIRAGRVFARQDTISFDLSQYATQRDNSLKDVLKKLPGVDVADNGQVSFNGKAIKHFTVENLDLTAGRYNALSEAIKAKDVARAEVIEHDQPVKALRNKVLTDDVAMNIKLKAGARDRLMPTLRPAVVTAFPLKTARPQGGADLLQIGRTRQRMYNVRHDRSGRDLSRSDDPLAQSVTSGYDNGQPVPAWIARSQLSAPVDAERIRRNRSWDVSVKETRRRGEEGEFRVTAGYLHTNERQQTGNSTTHFFGQENTVKTDETADFRILNDRLYLDLSATTNDSTAYGSEYFLLEGLRTDGLSRITNTATGDVTQRIKIPQLRLSNSFSRIWPSERHSFELRSVVDCRLSPMSLTLGNARTNLTTTMLHTDETAVFTLQRPFLTHRYSISLTAENLVRGHANGLLSLTATPWWQYKRGITRVVLNLPVSLQAFTRQGSEYVDASPSVLVNLRPGRRHELTGGFGLSSTTGGWDSFAMSGYMQDYRTEVITSGVIPRNRLLFGSLQYDYKRTLAELFSSFGLTWNRTFTNLMTDMTIRDGRYRLSTVQKNAVSSVLTARATVSKGLFRLHTKLSLGVDYSRVEGSQLSAGAVSSYSSDVLALTPGLTFSPSFGTFSYSGRFVISSMSTPGATHRTLADWVQRAVYTQSVGPVDLSLSAEHYRNELQDGTAVSSLLADAGVVLRLKRVRLSLSARNILNKQDYRLTAYSGVTSSTMWYRLRPREVILEAQVSL